MQSTGTTVAQPIPEAQPGRVCSLRISNSREMQRQSKLKINVQGSPFEKLAALAFAL
jgi:hypothetical protein